MKRALLAIALLALTTTSPACTIWYALNGDPGDIPCDPDGRCLDGFVCVDTGLEEPLCRRAANGDENTPCNVDGECIDGLVCVDVYGPDELCGTGSEQDPNCIQGAGDGKRCRSTCNPNNGAADCPTGQRCFDDNQGAGFCQSGVCTEDAECGVNPLSGGTNICFDLPNGEGSGLCVNKCDPFSCVNQGVTCNDCPALDVSGDGIPDTWGCIAVPFNNQLIAGRFGCLPVLDIAPGQNCAFATDCRTGSFCTTLIAGGNQGFCSQYCAENGNPACDVGSCQNNGLEPGIGFCQ